LQIAVANKTITDVLQENPVIPEYLGKHFHTETPGAKIIGGIGFSEAITK